MPKVIQVIESMDSRGKGEEGDPYRLVRQYHTLEGELLWECDEWMEAEKRNGRRPPPPPGPPDDTGGKHARIY